MRYCKKCVQPDTRPGIYFNEQGVCGACLYQEQIEKEIDWQKREKQLTEISEWAKQEAQKRKSNYHCVVGVSGGKDSTFQALYTRDKMGLRPLLVNSEPEGITLIGKKNIENLKELGFDVISIRPNPKVMKKLVKKDFYENMNPVKVTEFSLWASAYIIADKFNIPLMIQGENPGFTLGTRDIDLDDDALKAFQQDTLKSGWERYVDDGIDKEDLFFFHFDEQSLREKNIKAIWLQYFAKEWSPRNNARFSIKHGFSIRDENFNPENIGSYIPFAQLDSDLVQVNQLSKYVKFGFGQCTDFACHDIREGRISRGEGIELVKRFDGKCAQKYIKKFCKYIGIDQKEFWQTANKFRGEMWQKDKEDNWQLKDPIWEQEKYNYDEEKLQQIIKAV